MLRRFSCLPINCLSAVPGSEHRWMAADGCDLEAPKAARTAQQLSHVAQQILRYVCYDSPVPGSVVFSARYDLGCGGVANSR